MMPYKIAVITPYHKENLDILLKCHGSVLEQSYRCDHIFVADGYPREEINSWRGVKHVILPQENGDYGNTPRGIGAVVAEGMGYDAITFLDCDNYIASNHIENLVASHNESHADLISCRRLFISLDDKDLNIREPSEERGFHIDTNCWLIFKSAFFINRVWLMPKELASVGDRIFHQAANFYQIKIDKTSYRTVYYRSRTPNHYAVANFPIPLELKNKQIEYQKSLEYLRRPENKKYIIDKIGFYPAVDIR